MSFLAGGTLCVLRLITNTNTNTKLPFNFYIKIPYLTFPLIGSEHKINHGRRITCYPALAVRLDGNYKYSTDSVVVDGNMVSLFDFVFCFST